MYDPKAEAKRQIQNRIDFYEKGVKLAKTEDKYLEARVKSTFIEPFLNALGWKLDSNEVYPEYPVGRDKVDYALQVGGVGEEPKIFVEAKRFVLPEGLDSKERDPYTGEDISFPEKAIHYAWRKNVDWVILTNFKELRIYNVKQSKTPKKAERFRITHDKFLEEDTFKTLWAFSREGVASGLLDAFEIREKRKPVDRQFLDDLVKCRLLLIDNIRRRNKELEPELLKECVQRILDRLVVMRAAEDLGVEKIDRLRMEILKPREGWDKLNQWLFKNFNSRFNSRIFAKHPCDDLKIADEVIQKVVNILYNGTGESSGYRFDQIRADVLGSMYEDYIGYILKEEGEIYKLEKEMKKRKAKGIYYTPTYVVEYIVENTLGTLLKGMSPPEVKNIRILDPACGSGSFLTKAQVVLKRYYESTMEQLKKKEGEKIDLYISKDYASLSKDILTENIYGVDLDLQAAEIASVNLSLKILADMKEEMKLPEVMGENIKVGNSLISNHRKDLKKYFKYPAEKKPFNWDEEFSQVFEQGGFDVVIGNPPYGGKLDRSEKKYIEKEYACFGSKDTAEVFLELALKLTKENGMIGMIIPKSLAFYTAWSKIRKLLLREATIIRLCDVGIAFKDVNYEQLILIIKKCKANENAEVIIDRAAPLRRYLPKKEITTIGKVKQAVMNLENRLIFTPIPAEIEKVLQKISEKSVPLGSIAKEIFRGLYVADEIKRKLKPGKYKFLEKVPHVSRYSIKRLWEVDLSDKKWEKKIQKILRPRVFLKVLRGKRLVAGYDFGEIVTTEKLVNVVLEEDSGYDIRFITAVINSPVPSFYMQKALFSDTTETSRVMDEDYSGSIPIPKISPMMQLEQKNIVELVDKIVDFKKQLSKLNINFERYLTEPVIAETNFRDYYDKLDINEKEALDKMSKGNIRKLKVEEQGNWLVFKVDYVARKKGKKQEFKDVEIVKCKFKDELQRKFLFYTINNYKKPLGTGNLLLKILRIPVPRFDKDPKKNGLIITKMMQEYLKVVREKERLEKGIQETDDLINRKVYELYGLNEGEIKIIEESLQ